MAKESLRKGEKEKARRALRRRKYQESLLQQTDGQLETLEQLVRDFKSENKPCIDHWYRLPVLSSLLLRLQCCMGLNRVTRFSREYTRR